VEGGVVVVGEERCGFSKEEGEKEAVVQIRGRRDWWLYR
jgi:hypothetical protein